MTISLANAILAVKADEKWVKKIIIGGILALVATIASAMAQTQSFSAAVRIISVGIYFMFASVYCGFMISAGNKMLNSDSNALPEWTEPNLLLKGLKFLFSYIVYIFVFSILTALILIPLFLLVGLILGLIYFLIGLIFHTDCAAATPFICVVTAIVSIVGFLYMLQFYNAAYTSYCKTLCLKDLLAFKKQFRMIKDNPHASWTYVGKEILYALLFILISALCCVTILGILLLPFVGVAAYIAVTNLCAQYGKEILIERYL